jgi:hypothetical protein
MGVDTPAEPRAPSLEVSSPSPSPDLGAEELSPPELTSSTLRGQLPCFQAARLAAELPYPASELQ